MKRGKHTRGVLKEKGKDAEPKKLIHIAKNLQNTRSSHSFKKTTVKWPTSKPRYRSDPGIPNPQSGQEAMIKTLKITSR